MKVGRRALSILMSIILVLGLNPGVALAEPSGSYTAGTLSSEDAGIEADADAESNEGQGEASPIQALSTRITTLESEEPTVVATGECGAEGDNVTWTLDSEGTLTVAGEGEMADGKIAADYTDQVKAIVIEGGVTSIGKEAFRQVRYVTSVSLADGLKKIGSSAFSSCSCLAKVEMPQSVAELGSSAFASCSSLQSIVFSDAIELIPASACSNCGKLVSVHLPLSVKTISTRAFEYTSRLYSVVFPEGLKIIADYAFSSSSLSTHGFPDTLEEIGTHAFAFNGGSYIRIPGSVKVIGESAFTNNTMATTIVLDEGVETVGPGAFSHCRKAQSLTIPASVVSIGERPFEYCFALSIVSVAEGNVSYYMGDRALYTKDGTTLVACLPCAEGSFVIPEGVTTLSAGCFDYCESLTSISIPASLEEGNDKALLICGRPSELKSLTSYEVAEGNLAYRAIDGVLFDKSGKNLVGYPTGAMNGENYHDGSAHAYNVPEGVESIGAYAFYGCNLYDVVLPVSVTTIGVGAFGAMRSGNGACIRYAGTDEQRRQVPGLDDSVVCNTAAFGMTSDWIAYSLDTSGVLRLFYSNGARTSKKLPDFDRGSAPWASWADKVNTVIADDTFVGIGAYAFSDFTSLRQVTLSDAILSVGAGAFCGCDSLQEVVCKGNPFETEAADADEPTFPSTVTLVYYPGLGTWQADDSFDNDSGTWNGYHVATAVLPEIASIELTDDSIVAKGTASEWTTTTVGVTVWSAEGEDITDGVTVTVSHSEDFDYRTHPKTDDGQDLLYHDVKYKKADRSITVEKNAYADAYVVTASSDGLHSSGDDASAVLAVTRPAEFQAGLTAWRGTKITNNTGQGLVKLVRFENQFGEEYKGTDVTIGVVRDVPYLDITNDLESYGIYCIGNKVYGSQRTPGGSYTFSLSGPGTAGAASSMTITNTVVWHTATFMAGGKVVDAVEFAERAKSLDEPAVPERENYHGEWSAYDLAFAKGDITVEAVYTPIDTDAVSEIDVKADESDNGDGTKTIVLSASAATQTVRAEKTNAKPLDVVLVLDQSGSMADTLSATDARSKRDALVECANDFLGKLFDNAQNTGADHRVALAGFAYSAYNGGAYRNTGLLATAGGGSKGYASLSVSDYANALLPISSCGALNPAVAAGVERVAAEGATAADLGLKMARNIFSSQGDAGERERVVVFITDGTPTCWGETPQLIERTAAAAISEAGYLKGTQGAKVYTVGVHESADPAADFNGASNGIVTDARGSFKSYDLNRFMHAVSSNYPSATSMASLGAGDKAAGYYLGVTDTGNLSNIFRDILYTTVFETKVFDRATLTCKLARGVELEWGQERDICENLGLAAGDVTVTRNDDGTCDIVMRNVPVALADDGTGALVYQAQLAFQVTFEGEAAVAQVRATVSDRSEVGGEASYSSAHEHSFAEVSRTGTCETGVTAHYACSCGAERDEIVVAAGTQHDYVAEITDDGGLAQSVERLVCSGCGHVIDKNINYQVAYSKGFRTAVLDLSLLENEVVVQPDGTIGMRFYVGESGARSYVVTRISEDGNRTVYQTRLVDGWLVFDADHFSVYAVAEADEDGNPVAGDISYETAQLALAGEDVDADIASGTWGTCPWEISADGTLTVHPGVGEPVLDDNYAEGKMGYDFANEGPWTAYADSVTRVVFAKENGEKVVAPKDAQALCLGLSKAESVDLSGLDLSGSSSIVRMFGGCESLKSVDLSEVGTSRIGMCADLFLDCSSLESVSFGSLKLTPSFRMFLGCSSLEYLDLTSFAEPVGDISGMFNLCSGLKTILVSDKWSMGKVSYTDYMFNKCTSLVGGNGTVFDADHIDGEYARVDAAGVPGYLTGDASTVKKDISRATVTLEKASAAYTGSAQSGVVKSVVLDGVTLEAGADYTVSAASGKDVGSYAVTVTGAGDYKGTATATFKITPASSSVKLAAQTKTYSGRALAYSGKVTRSGSGGKVAYAYYSDAACKKVVKAANVKAAGTYYVKATLAADANHEAATSAAAKFTIAKAANPMSVAAKTASVKYSKKKAQAVKAASAYSFKKKAVGTVTYARVAKGSSKWLSAVNKKTGAITVKAGAPKGKTQAVKVKVTAAGNGNYKSASKTITVKVKVK